MNNNKQKVDIIIPVYAGTEETLACIDSVLESIPRLKTRTEVIVIFDAGPDVALRDALLGLASRNKITLLINETNQGFVRSINSGILRSDHDVLLLNSDTIVANDWLDRIVRRAYVSTNIATVTPFSNNAELASWPRLCEFNELYAGYSVAEIDQAFSKLDAPSVPVPTAVGFCMFIKRDCIKRIGVFDAETFGRGYGEENDFCMRASAINFTHVLASNVFVYHRGAVSFGESKKELVQAAMQILDRKYPDYHARIARHIEEDPARCWRFAAELVLRSQQDTPLVLHISHGIGGGTDKHVVELASYCSDQLQHGMLVPQASCMRLVFPNVVTGGLFEIPYEQMGALKNFLFALSLARVHIHHVKGWESHIHRILEVLAVPYDITLHDYYFLHSNPALADKHGFFCTDPKRRDAVSAEAIPLPRGMTAEQWRQQWKSLLKRAERVIAPSYSVAAIYNQYHPALEISCVFHPDHEHISSYPAVSAGSGKDNKELHVVVLGALSLIKGANMLEKVSLLAAKQNAPIRFTLLGYAYRKLANTVYTLGSYRDENLPALLESCEPDLVWFPCTWPETYSYTLSAALEAGLPVACPNLGSFPERLQNRPLTWIEPWDQDAERWLETLLIIAEEIQANPGTRQWAQQPASVNFYASQYRHPGVTPEIEMVPAEQLMQHWLRELPEASGVNRRLYRILIWLNSHRLFGHVANLIPMWVRRSVKRKLSTQPIHE